MPSGADLPTALNDYEIGYTNTSILDNSAFLAIKHAGEAMKVTGKGGKERSGGSIICTASG